MLPFIFIIGVIVFVSFVSSHFEEHTRRGDLIKSMGDANVALIAEREELIKKSNSLEQEVAFLRPRADKLSSKLSSVEMELRIARTKNIELSNSVEKLQTAKGILQKTLSEAPFGFPTLLKAIKKADDMRDERLAEWLETKSHPAYTSAQIVRDETKKRREAEYESRQAKALLEYYFSIFPDIQEEQEKATDDIGMIEAPPKSDKEDIVCRYLSNYEYSRLSITERNQLALDRFWKMHKSKLLIGRLYEQYIGSLYERKGWQVEYFGISKGLSDLGRDLICRRGITTLLIQCKNWSKSKTIYEKHIFQLFGTSYEYMKNNPFEDVHGVFYTSTALSDLARSFAREFHIELHENFALRRFPIIKCNIGREGERIYHLPFDQQYYTTKINPKDGDFYCTTVAEAEAKGFRRAYRWHGNKW